MTAQLHFLLCKRQAKELKAKIELQKYERETFAYLSQYLNCDEQYYNQRSMVERVNKLLKDDFGCNTIKGLNLQVAQEYNFYIECFQPKQTVLEVRIQQI